MNWITISLIAPFIWSLLNILDKYLISKYSHHVGVGGLIIMSSIFAVFTLPIIYIIDHGVFALNFAEILILILSGFLSASGILFYLYALDRDDASHVVPFWLMIPIISYLLDVFFLNEVIESSKVIGSLVTIFGALILSLEFDQGFVIKKITPVLMFISSLFLATNNILFKSVTISYSFWQSIFWNQFGLFLFATVMLVFVARYRRDFINVIKVSNTELTLINIVGEVLQVIATTVSYYAVLLAPVSLVLLISYTFQPLFVFIEGVLFTFIFPKLINERISRGYLAQKILAITLMIVGVYQIML